MMLRVFATLAALMGLCFTAAQVEAGNGRAGLDRISQVPLAPHLYPTQSVRHNAPAPAALAGGCGPRGFYAPAPSFYRGSYYRTYRPVAPVGFGYPYYGGARYGYGYPRGGAGFYIGF